MHKKDVRKKEKKKAVLPSWTKLGLNVYVYHTTI